MSTLGAAAHAKVNLALAVTGRRADGYHTLRSVFLALALHDELEVDVADRHEPDSLVLSSAASASPESALPRDDNLVLRAVACLREALAEPLPPLRFSLRKRIPIAAGLGGGSSDAAAAIDLALRAWQRRLHPAARLDVALRLGADVPFFSAACAAALVHGIGEGLQPLPAPRPPLGLLLITPAERLSTAAVFAELDRLPAASQGSVEQVAALADALRGRLEGRALAAMSPRLSDANDLWPPAARLSSGLAAARRVAADALDRPLLLTGSGPTLFTLYPSEAEARRAARQLRRERPDALAGAAIMATSSISSGGTS